MTKKHENLAIEKRTTVSPDAVAAAQLSVPELIRGQDFLAAKQGHVAYGLERLGSTHLPVPLYHQQCQLGRASDSLSMAQVLDGNDTLDRIGGFCRRFRGLDIGGISNLLRQLVQANLIEQPKDRKDDVLFKLGIQPRSGSRQKGLEALGLSSELLDVPEIGATVALALESAEAALLANQIYSKAKLSLQVMDRDNEKDARAGLAVTQGTIHNIRKRDVSMAQLEAAMNKAVTSAGEFMAVDPTTVTQSTFDNAAVILRERANATMANSDALTKLIEASMSMRGLIVGVGDDEQVRKAYVMQMIGASRVFLAAMEGVTAPFALLKITLASAYLIKASADAGERSARTADLRRLSTKFMRDTQERLAAINYAGDNKQIVEGKAVDITTPPEMPQIEQNTEEKVD